MSGKVFAIEVYGELDQICYSPRQANKEANDLKRMGFDKIKVKPFPSETLCNNHYDKKRGY